MKRFIRLTIVISLWFSTIGTAQKSNLQQQLELLPEVKSVQPIEHLPFFTESYEIMIEQLLDHKNPGAGKFQQRVILSNYNPYSPVVFVTEGYQADYATSPTYANELSTIINANQIVVEHRYFGKSIPTNLNWDYLTIENSCADLHRIQRIFSKIYNNKNKWIGTGISKGGTQTLCYYALYPKDMNIWIPYVAPINFKVEDGRHELFLKSVGSAQCRNKILTFQKRVLNERERITPLLDSLSQSNHYTYRISTNELLDYCVLEYSFSFWQWGYQCSTIPADSLGFRSDFNHLIQVCNPSYFAEEGIDPIQAFFVQAQRQLGYYGYDTDALKDELTIESSKGYLSRLFMPKGVCYKFNNKISKKVVKAINKDGSRVMLIYGEFDPWTASGVTPNRKSKAIKVVNPSNNHQSRIGNLPLSIKKDVYMTLETWLEED